MIFKTYNESLFSNKNKSNFFLPLPKMRPPHFRGFLIKDKIKK